jgi:hypothetical protein
VKKIKLLFAAMAVAVGLGGGLLVAQPVGAVNVFDQCSGNADSAVCKSQGDSAQTMIKSVVNLLLFVLGVIAVIMIIVGGIRYTTSNGDSGAITSAKNTILYSVVGLIVAMLSFAIVNFVVGSF